MSNEYLENIKNNVIGKLDGKYTNVDIAMVLGSGLSAAAPLLSDMIEIPYDTIGFPQSKVKGHSGKFVFGKYNGKNIVIAGRIHYYENGNIENVKLPFQILHKLGVKTLILATACGGINYEYNPGDIMLINDQLNLSGVNPLVNSEKIEFIDLSNLYDSEYRNLIKQIANAENIPLKEGIFVQLSGPTYETPAEIKMLRILGGDAVSMSTAIDAITAKSLGMRIIGFSAITNKAAGMDKSILTHEDVLENSKRITKNLGIMLKKFIDKI